ncbi:hypothetical protein BOTBODRAFT_32082 [Botryobasidium botryosum FD-172 SS1]|uniref:Acireductone dioxygenase n=1 Tax=Botryobasidium botryosum (strain FD-172 SS1) TaxID=930990 RepID=A0A067MK45_BOTB1|nr:hypothetical protein BOTBODRAFT_32082 [Botryobasidium botryosum FD-172 SS1]
MRAYIYDNEPTDQRLPHETSPSQPISVEALNKLGVLYWNIPVEGDWEQEINKVAEERSYKNRDTINVSKEGLGDAYESKIRSFFEEHLHEDEEIRYIIEGSGFFDVRDVELDQWIRIAITPGDLLVLPAGIYHRFTLDEANNIKALRLFKDEPKWVPHPRSAETEVNPYRQQYLQSRGIPVA